MNKKYATKPTQRSSQSLVILIVSLMSIAYASPQLYPYNGIVILF